MKDLRDTRNRYMRDALPIRLGGLAADLARIASFSHNPANLTPVADVMREAAHFVEWCAPEADVEDQATLLELQRRLGRWHRQLPQCFCDRAWREELIAEARRWGERVLEILCRAFPRAPIFTMLHDPGAVSGTINRHPVHTSLLQQVPGARRHYRMFLPVMPYLVERFRPPEADILISTSHCVAKGIRPPPGMRHLCYCFTPMRYVWVFYEEYFGKSRLKQGLLSPLLGRLREWDRRSSRRVDRFVAISRNVQRRIESCYQRPADVVYPPVDLEWFTPGPGTGGEYDLIVSALVPYKRIDLAVRAYSRTGYPLVIVGTGTEYERLRRMAAENITFLGRQPDEAVRELYRGCRCLVFPGKRISGWYRLRRRRAGGRWWRMRPVVCSNPSRKASAGFFSMSSARMR